MTSLRAMFLEQACYFVDTCILDLPERVVECGKGVLYLVSSLRASNSVIF